jgi:hypothetical protein
MSGFRGGRGGKDAGVEDCKLRIANFKFDDAFIDSPRNLKFAIPNLQSSTLLCSSLNPEPSPQI